MTPPPRLGESAGFVAVVEPGANTFHPKKGLAAYGLFEHLIPEQHLRRRRPGGAIDQRVRPFVNH